MVDRRRADSGLPGQDYFGEVGLEFSIAAEEYLQQIRPGDNTDESDLIIDNGESTDVRAGREAGGLDKRCLR
jgi:hypothetical protein